MALTLVRRGRGEVFGVSVSLATVAITASGETAMNSSPGPMNPSRVTA